jgi:hypothetical protein
MLRYGGAESFPVFGFSTLDPRGYFAAFETGLSATNRVGRTGAE